ncbi:MAG: radical SAM protein [Phycisphaeraceae bacterium]
MCRTPATPVTPAAKPATAATSATSGSPSPAQESAVLELNQLREQGVPLLPVKVPRHYRRLVEAEIAALGRTGGPLHAVVYPKADRFSTFAPGEVTNFVEDFGHMPAGLERVIVHRYPAKLLYFPTDTCVGHCQYCFRPDITGTDPARKNRHRNLDDDVLDRVVDYLGAHPGVREVIFSGGDPLACKADALDHALSRILAVPTVRWCRFHTKAPLFAPGLLSERMIEVLGRHRVKLVIHAVHPYELGDEVGERLAEARRHDVLLYNQFPLLRGINDHADVLLELAYRCVDLGVQMLTMFIADPIRYGATYRLRLQRVFDLADEVFLRGEGWVSNFRVCMDSPLGKVRREHVVAHDPDRDVYVFERDCRQVTYQDIPAAMDVPTPAADLLYNGTRFVAVSR